MNEPKVRKSSCSYCGDAPVHHAFSFLESLIQIPLDNYGKKLIKHVPFFVKSFADAVPEFLFQTLVFFGLAEFSDDIEKAATFRSRVIWEEAKRRGMPMEQVIFMSRPLDYYRANLRLNGQNKFFYFESLPIRPEAFDLGENWDDKVALKREFKKHNIPVPDYFELSPLAVLGLKNVEKEFSRLKKPVVVKPRSGSRGRHTVTHINNLSDFQKGIRVAGQICSHLVAEEHLEGSVCRATLVDGRLAGFYLGRAPTLTGDGKKTIRELIRDLDNSRPGRVEPIRIGEELQSHLGRLGFDIDSVLPKGRTIPLSHRIGRLFGGRTREMLGDLHPNFVPALEKAAKVVGLPVVGFDCIIPDPTKEESGQRWGIIECNTLPFIDLHYYALEGKPQNIAGLIWDLWKS